MFTYLQGLFSNDLLVELSESQLKVMVFGSDIVFEDEPYIALETLSKGPVVKAIGKQAKLSRSSSTEVINPFKHSRSFIADFFYAELVLQHAIREVCKMGIFRPAPRVIMHQLEKTEGGLTNIEQRVLRELALGAGAREVIIHVGDKLDIRNETYKSVKQKIKSS